MSTIFLEYDSSGIGIGGKSANEQVVNFIRNAWKPEHSISQFYKEVQRALLNHFGTYNYIDRENKLVNIKCTAAHPERAVAKFFKTHNLILPVITIGQLTSELDNIKRRQEHILVTDKIFDPIENRAKRIVSFCPVPVKINYDVYIWTKYKEDLDQITEQIRLAFNPNRTFQTKFGNPKGFIISEADNSVLEGEDKEDRLLRKMFSVQVEGYIPSPKFLLTSTGKIEVLNYEMFVD